MLRLQELWLLRSGRHAPVNVKLGRGELGTGLTHALVPRAQGCSMQDPQQEGESKGSIFSPGSIHGAVLLPLAQCCALL